MARVIVTAQALPGPNPTVTANSRDLSMQAGDPGLGNYLPIVEGKTVLLVQNTHATDPQTVTITSVADSIGRLGHITNYSLAAGELAVFGPYVAAAWSHGNGADGGLWVDVSDASVKLANITQK